MKGLSNRRSAEGGRLFKHRGTEAQRVACTTGCFELGSAQTPRPQAAPNTHSLCLCASVFRKQEPKLRFSLGVSAALWCLALGAAPCTLYPAPGILVSQNRADALYRCGDQASFTVSVVDAAGRPLRSGKAKWALDNFGDMRLGEGTAALDKENPFVVKATLKEPGFLRLRVASGTNVVTWSVGYDVGAIRQTAPRPADFDAYWQGEKERLAREVPMDVTCEEATWLPKAPKWRVYLLSFPTFGGKRLYGFLTVPRDVSKAPFRARVRICDAGDGAHGPWEANENEVTATLNVHYFRPGKTKAEQHELIRRLNESLAEKYGRKGLTYRNAGIEGARGDYYFHDAMVGLARAVDYIATRPEVDPSRVVYYGSSQGGGFGLFVNYLNPRFARAAFVVPALTGHFGHLQNRADSWPTLVKRAAKSAREAVERNAPYYDGVNFAAGIRHPVRFVVGFSDACCPPPAVYSAYNACPSPDKLIVNCIGSGHDQCLDWIRLNRGKPSWVDVNDWLRDTPQSQSVNRRIDKSKNKKVEVMAVYYPHWHQYPKGDEWFGADKWKEGEWEFVKTARPRFPGHLQPIQPLMGYLNGKDPRDVETEIALASGHGIDVFLYDYYWYGGKVTQQEALEQGFLKAKNRSQMKFALMWCYHPRVDAFRCEYGKEKRLLMGLDYTPEEFLGLIGYSIRHYFAEPEYWRHDGKLFFSVYQSQDFLDKLGDAGAKAALKKARQMVRAAGLGEVEFNAQGFWAVKQVERLKKAGFDSVTNYGCNPYSLPRGYARMKGGEWLFDFAEAEQPLKSQYATFANGPLPYYPIVPTGWDSTPRCRPDVKFPWPKGLVDYPYSGTYTNNTPEIFERYLRTAREVAEKTSGVVYINAWNEYTEGCHLLPTIRESDARLRAIGRVFGRRPAGKYVYSQRKRWWDKSAPNEGWFVVDEPTVEGAKYGPHVRQSIDVWLPKGRKGGGKAPLLVNIHGGGWEIGDRMMGVDKMLAKCRSRGVALASVNYRLLADGRDAGLVPPVRAPLDDALAALGYIRAHAEGWGVDPARIALTGGSAGACSSLYVALANDCALGIRAVHAQWPQTSLDPKEMREWIPNSTYGAGAFGYAGFQAWLDHRAEGLSWIEKYSPAGLLRACTPAKAPSFFYEGAPFLRPGELAKDPTHSPTFCQKFEEIAHARGIACRRGTLDDVLNMLAN